MGIRTITSSASSIRSVLVFQKTAFIFAHTCTPNGWDQAGTNHPVCGCIADTEHARACSTEIRLMAIARAPDIAGGAWMNGLVGAAGEGDDHGDLLHDQAQLALFLNTGCTSLHLCVAFRCVHN